MSHKTVNENLNDLSIYDQKMFLKISITKVITDIDLCLSDKLSIIYYISYIHIFSHINHF